jgi:recombination DNA repair RAD52 pathway protein
MTEESISSLLSNPFPAEKIKQRKVFNNGEEKTVDYVPGQEVIRRLNEVFNNDWSFVVVDKIIDTSFFQVCVLGELRVKAKYFDQNATDDAYIVKQQWGGSRIATFSRGGMVLLGDDLKIATTDALKKCATQFGVALYLYDNDDLTIIKETTPAVEQNKIKTLQHSAANSHPSSKEVKGEKVNTALASEIQRSSITNILKDKGFSIEQLEKFLGYPLASVTTQEANSIIMRTHLFWKSPEAVNKILTPAFDNVAEEQIPDEQ